MTEKNPQFSYSPEGILEFNVELATDEYRAVQQDLLDQLNESEGIEVSTIGKIAIDIKSAFGSEFGLNQSEIVGNFVETLSRLNPYVPESRTDLVSYAQHISQRALVATVYPSLQQWLGSEESVSEPVAREAITAMAVPFGKEYEEVANKKFRLSSNGAEALHFMYAIHGNDFYLYRAYKTEEHYIEQTGSATWNNLSLTTVGNCACLGVEATDRNNISTGEDAVHPWLYEMRPHNIDIPQQALSLILGVGTVAYRAAQYQGSRDIMNSVAWGEERRFPVL